MSLHRWLAAAWARRETWLLLVCSLGVCTPLLIHGPSCGHDFDFHLLSWLEAAHDWHHGLLDPHWLATANFGAGEPRFIFYPPISWVLGGVLGALSSVLVGPQTGWTLAPALFTFLCVFTAGYCVYLLACTLASRQSAIAAACIFTANPYMLFVAYERTAYGELLATPLMALLLLSALRRKLSVVPLAVLVGALWLTNAPAAVMGCYMLALISVLRLWKERCWGNAGKAIGAVVLGLALAGVYLVPAVWQQHWVQIGRAVSSGMRIEDSFLFARTGQAYHDQVLHAASIIVVMLFVVAAVSLAVRIVVEDKGRKSMSGILAVLLGVILFLQFPASRLVWHAAPQMDFLQFPWRWMLVASIATAALLASAMALVSFESLRAKVILYGLALLIAGTSLWAGSRSFVQSCDEEDRVSGQLEAFYSGSGVEGTDEYTAVGSDNSAIFQDLPEVRLIAAPDAEEPREGAGDNPEWTGTTEAAAGEARVQRWQSEQKVIDVATTRPAFAVLRLMDYPSWDVLLKGRSVVGRLRREDGLMVIAVPAGTSHILVRWKITPDIRLGRGLSAVATFILLMLGILRSRSATVRFR